MPPKKATPSQEAFDSMVSDISSLKDQFSELAKKFDNSQREIDTLKDANKNLVTDIDYMKTIINKQAGTIATLDRELDDLNQYGRRENIVFTNLQVNKDNAKSQVIELCQELGVDVQDEDLVDAHPLPSKRGKPTRIIARFHERSKTKKVFINRKGSKNISTAKKSKLAANINKGFAIQPNLTVKRAQLFSQVQEFCAKYQCAGTWVDFNTGKIFLKLKDGQRGYHIKDTGDLIDVNSSFIPGVWHFCVPPMFDY